MSGPITVAVPPITRATRNSIEFWKTSTLSALALKTINTDNDPAIPAYIALKANASTLVRARSTPTDDAAASWSRTAISERPKRLRAITQTPITPMIAREKHIVYAHWSWAERLGKCWVNQLGAASSAGVSATRLVPPVPFTNRVAMSGKMTARPSVTSARYRPFTRSAGKPTSAPMTNVTIAQGSSVAMNDMCPNVMPKYVYSWSMSSAVVYAPTPKNAPWPMDTWPLYPVRILRPIAAMPM